jgi:hypothetical protein
MSAEARTLFGARPRGGELGTDEQPQRVPGPGIRHRGEHIELAVPKLRRDSYYPGWLLTPRRRWSRHSPSYWWDP